MRRPALLVLLAVAVSSPAAALDSPLARHFASPPPETRPWTFWYWMNNHVSREGITRDLEAMKKFGIGTVIIGNVYMADLPAGNVPMFSPEWEELTVFAIREGQRIGIDFGFFNCPGWSQSGGPWISADQTMRFLNWSETRVEGGARFTGTLPKPRPDFQDVGVVAFPSSAEEEQTLRNASPRITAANAPDDPQRLVDGDPATIVRFPEGRSEWQIGFETAQPITVRSLTIHPSKANFTLRAELRARPPGAAPRSVRRFTIDRSNNRLAVGPVPFAPVTMDIPATTAAQWELILTEINTLDPNAMWLPPQQTPEKAGFAEIELSAAPRLDRVMEKQLAKVHPRPPRAGTPTSSRSAPTPAPPRAWRRSRNR
jgi:hypothetical protein